MIEILKQKKGIDSSTIEIVRDGELVWMREIEVIGRKRNASYYVTLAQNNFSLRDYLCELPKIEDNKQLFLAEQKFRHN